MISGTPMPYKELAMLWRLLDHERYCLNIPFEALHQHVANLKAIQKPPEPEQRALFRQEKLALRRELLETECEMKAQAAGLDVSFARDCLLAVENDDVAAAAKYGVMTGDYEKPFLLAVRRWVCAKLVLNNKVVPLTYNSLTELLASNEIFLGEDEAVSKMTHSFSKMFAPGGVLYGFFKSRTRRRRARKKTYVI